MEEKQKGGRGVSTYVKTKTTVVSFRVPETQAQTIHEFVHHVLKVYRRKIKTLKEKVSGAEHDQFKSIKIPKDKIPELSNSLLDKMTNQINQEAVNLMTSGSFSNEKDRKSRGKAFKAQREAAKMTIKQAGDSLGVPSFVVSTFESGAADMPIDKMDAYAHILGMKLIAVAW